MARVKTYDLTIYSLGKTPLVFRSISRVAVDRYVKFYCTTAATAWRSQELPARGVY